MQNLAINERINRLKIGGVFVELQRHWRGFSYNSSKFLFFFWVHFATHLQIPLLIYVSTRQSSMVRSLLSQIFATNSSPWSSKKTKPSANFNIGRALLMASAHSPAGQASSRNSSLRRSTGGNHFGCGGGNYRNNGSTHTGGG